MVFTTQILYLYTELTYHIAREIHILVCLNSDMSGYHEEQENFSSYWLVYSTLGLSSRGIGVV